MSSASSATPQASPSSTQPPSQESAKDRSPQSYGNDEPREHSLWSPAIAGQRKTFFKTLLMFFGITTIILWLVLPLFWGSTLLLERYFPRLHVHVVDYDSQASGTSAIAGPYVTAALRQVSMQPGPHLTYDIVDPAMYPGGPQEVMTAVAKSGPWGAVVINSNATSAWRNAVTTGNGAYEASGSVGLFYSGARFYQIVLLYVVPLMLRNTYSAVSSASQAAGQQFLCANAGATAAAQNAGALTTASAAPSAIGNVFGIYTYDVNPITAWASGAPMEAGLIYLTVLCFDFALLSFFGRLFSGLGNRLKFKSLVLMRLTSCFVMYAALSLWYTCVNQAFQEPLESGGVGRAGFVVFWALGFVTLTAVGLQMEAMISLLTAKFFPFFLIYLIISNLTSSFLPIDLMQPFYRWGYAWPFFQNVQGTKVILYGVQSSEFLGRYFGVLLAWSGINIISLIFCSWFERRRGDNAAKKAAQQQQQQKGKAEA